MRAIVYDRYGGPEVFELREIDKPIPKGNEVLIKIHATLVTAADGLMRRGVPFIGRFVLGFTKPKKPIPGTEFAGVVEAVGKEVTRFKVGDPVVGSNDIGFGTYAEYLALPEKAVIAVKPSNMNFGEAVAISEGTMTALPFLRDEGKIRSGQRVLINGASGAVGTAAVQLAKHFGAEVTGVCSTSNVEMVKSLGGDKVIDYTRKDFTSGTETYDIIFDTVGKTSFGKCRKVLSENGRYLCTVLGIPLMMRMMWTSIFGKKKARFAATGLRKHDEKNEDLRFLIGLFEAGTVRPFIDREYPLEDIAEAHRYVDGGHKRGNVVINMKQNDSTE